MSTLTTDIAAWTAAVHNGAERVASTMDRQTDLFGMFINKMRGMREAVDHLSASAVSSSWAAVSTVADEEEDEEVDEEAVGKEEEQEEDIVVDVMMGEVDDESGGDEEENEGGEGDDNDDEDEEGGEEGRLGTSGAEQDAAPEASASVQVVDQPRVLRPQWRAWKDKGKGKMQWEK
jgi:hypothetical protein